MKKKAKVSGPVTIREWTEIEMGQTIRLRLIEDEGERHVLTLTESGFIIAHRPATEADEVD